MVSALNNLAHASLCCRRDPFRQPTRRPSLCSFAQTGRRQRHLHIENWLLGRDAKHLWDHLQVSAYHDGSMGCQVSLKLLAKDCVASFDA